MERNEKENPQRMRQTIKDNNEIFCISIFLKVGKIAMFRKKCNC